MKNQQDLATNLNSAELEKLFQQTNSPWGLSTCIDLYECDPAIISSTDKIREFTIHLCEQLKVNRFGEPVIVHFGRDERVKGYSLVQLIETSLVSGHFAEIDNSAYIDIFSCKFYDPAVAYEYCTKFFKATKSSVKTVLRGEQ